MMTAVVFSYVFQIWDIIFTILTCNTMQSGRLPTYGYCLLFLSVLFSTTWFGLTVARIGAFWKLGSYGRQFLVLATIPLGNTVFFWIIGVGVLCCGRRNNTGYLQV
jgi:hypothetical protein